jgi:hypothetical protein
MLIKKRILLFFSSSEIDDSCCATTGCIRQRISEYSVVIKNEKNGANKIKIIRGFLIQKIV